MPDWRAEIRRRLAPAALRKTREHDIVEEVGQHLDDCYARSRTGGATDEEAAPSDLPPPGGSHGTWRAGLWHDFRYALRTIRRAPLFAATVVLASALSIGPVTTVLSVGNWLLWRPHPGVSDSRSLALVWFGEWRSNGSFSPAGVSYENLDDIRSRARAFTAVEGVMEQTASLSIAERPPVEAAAALVTANFFTTLGVKLSAGRSFAPDEDRAPAGAPVVLISQQLARSTFGAADAAVGKMLRLNSQPFSVIGVVAPAFRGISSTSAVDVWLTGSTWPYLAHADPARNTSRGKGFFYQFVIRTAPRAQVTEVERELQALTRWLAESAPNENGKFATVAPRVFPSLSVPPLSRPELVTTVNTLLAVGAVLLLLGCANVGNLLVFRVARQTQEIAIRKALGASWPRLLQLQMMESWLLSLAGAAVGLALAVFLAEAVALLLLPTPSGSGSVPIDRRVLGGTVAVTLVTGTLAALAPALMIARMRGIATRAGTHVTFSHAPKLRTSLAVLQLALSVTLLTGALLLVSTIRNLRDVDLGFDPTRVTVMGIDLSAHGYDHARALAYHREVLPALQRQREFERVSLSAREPFGSGSLVSIVPPDADVEKSITVAANGVNESYFTLLSIPIVRGRAFTADEAFGAAGESALIVNETLARQLFHTVDVVGRTVRLARTAANPARELVIVGVAQDSRVRSITSAQEPFLYHPFSHFPVRGVTRGVYMLKSSLPPQQAGARANGIAARTAFGIPLTGARPLTLGIDRKLSVQRVLAWMLSLLAGLGFALAGLGLFGLMSQTTTERRREFAIRLALGAAGRDIVRLVARYAGIVWFAGVGAGVLLSLLGSRVIERLLFGVTPLDPFVHVAAAVILAGVVAVACVWPTWKAVHVQAAERLRGE